jgi:WhiB family transcriptional regulator, redox-sensing transcriptional regulator
MDEYLGPGKREGMAPMQWRDATVSVQDTTGLEASGSAACQERSDIRQVQVGYVGQVRQVTGSAVTEVSVARQFAVTGPATALPVGLDLPCTQDPELFFAESPQDVEQAKAMCRGCRARLACLAGALERREPWGVWGGELLIRGTVVPRKRPRGRPRKDEVAA